MMSTLVKYGAPARLFPVYPESCKEQRSLSIVLAAMVSVRPFAERVLAPLNVRVGKRTTISCYTEVTLANEVKGIKDRPDALIVVETGKSSWSALVEAKVGKNSVEREQLERYIELARLNNIDAVLTVTNELTPAPNLHPTEIPKGALRNVSLYHFSWASILTTAFLLAAAKASPFENADEAFIVSELIRYLEHPNSGRVPLDQMNPDWPKIVAAVQAGHPVNGKGSEISEMISAWHQEARDVALIMSRKLKEAVSLGVSKSQLSNRDDWVDAEIRDFCDTKMLSFDLDVPNAASRISVEADFLRRALRVSMKLAAPGDRVSNGAKVNWLLKQLQRAHMEKITVRCITKGRAQNYGAMANELDSKSDDLKALSEIASFQVEMASDLGARFNSRKKFIESIEDIVPAFYENVGQHLQSWVAPPPKMKKDVEEITETHAKDSVPAISDVSVPAITAEKPANSDRPDWANVWQADWPTPNATEQ